MDIKIFKRKQKSLERDRSFCLMLTPVLLLMILGLFFAYLSKDTIIHIVPPGELKSYKITSDRATAAYKTSWGLSVANLVGNSTPEEAPYILKALSSMMDNKAYNKIRETLLEHFNYLGEKGITTKFTPKYFELNKKDEVVVNGELTLETRTKSESKPFTFIVKVAISQYKPAIQDLDFHEGSPENEK